MTMMITLQIFHFQNDYLYLTNGTLKGRAKKVSLSAKYYQEDRSGGVKEWNENLRGNDSIYGESIYTDR